MLRDKERFDMLPATKDEILTAAALGMNRPITARAGFGRTAE